MNILPAGTLLARSKITVLDSSTNNTSGLGIAGLNSSSMPTLILCISGAANSTITLSSTVAPSASQVAGQVMERAGGEYEVDHTVSSLTTVYSINGAVGTTQIFSGAIPVGNSASIYFGVNTITNNDTTVKAVNMTQIGGNTISVTTSTGVISFGGTSSVSTNAITFGAGLPWPANFSSSAFDTSGRVQVQTGSAAGQLDATGGVVKANLVQILATALTETAGQIAAAFKKFFNIAVPVATAGSVDQSGDAFARIGTAGAGLTAIGDTRLAFLDTAISTVLTAINNITAYSSLAGMSFPPQMEIPDSGSSPYFFILSIKNDQGLNVDLNASSAITLTATNVSGADRSANFGATSHIHTGVYSIIYTVSSNAAEEALTISAASFVGTNNRYTAVSTAVVNEETITTLLAVKAQTDKIATNAGDSPNAVTAQGAITLVKAKTDNLPASPASTADILGVPLAVWTISTNQAAVDGPSTMGYDIPFLAFVAAEGTANAATAAIMATNACANTASLPVMISANKFTTAALSNAPSGGGGSGFAFNGARAVTFSMQDNASNLLQATSVRIAGVGGAELHQQGVASNFTTSLDDLAYLVSATCKGYQFTPITVTVDASDTSFVLVFVPLNITSPADPDHTTGYFITLGDDEQPKAGVTVYYRITVAPGGSGHQFPGTVRSETSDGSGLWQAPLSKGATYAFSTSINGPWSVTKCIPSGAGTSLALNNFYA